jgi:hypothetical protein
MQRPDEQLRRTPTQSTDATGDNELVDIVALEREQRERKLREFALFVKDNPGYELADFEAIRRARLLKKMDAASEPTQQPSSSGFAMSAKMRDGTTGGLKEFKSTTSIAYARNWIENAELLFEVYQWPETEDRRKVLLARSALDATAKDQLRAAFDDVSQLSWAQFRQWMLDSTGDDSSRANAATQRMLTLKQKGESFDKYYNRWGNVWNDHPEDLPELLKVHLFIHTLDPAVRTQLGSSDWPKTWLEVRSRGLIAERMCSDGSTSREEPAERNNNHPKGKKRDRRVESPENQDAQSRRARSGTNDQTVRPTTERERPNRGYPDRTRFSKREDIVCFACNKPGHIRPNCPETEQPGRSSTAQDRQTPFRGPPQGSVNATQQSRATPSLP